MTAAQPDRLDRVERILAELAASQQATAARVDRQFEEEREQRLESQNQFQRQLEEERQQRLESDRRFEQRFERFSQELEETKKIADSNARSNQANSSAIAELNRSQTTILQELRAAVADLVDMLTTQAIEAGADRAELRRMIEAMYGQRSNGNGGGE